LEATAAVIVCRPETCLVFDLNRRSTEASATGRGQTPGAGGGRPAWLPGAVRVLEDWRRRLAGQRARDPSGKRGGNSTARNPDSSDAGPSEGSDAP